MSGLNGRSSVILNALVSEALKLGLFNNVNQHETKSAPLDGLACDIWLDRVSPNNGRSGLAVTSATLIFNVLIQLNFKSQPEDNIDSTLLNATDAYIDALHANLDLDESQSTLDVGGMSGTQLGATAVYREQDKSIYRGMLIVVPVLVDNVWIQV